MSASWPRATAPRAAPVPAGPPAWLSVATCKSCLTGPLLPAPAHLQLHAVARRRWPWRRALHRRLLGEGPPGRVSAWGPACPGLDRSPCLNAPCPSLEARTPCMPRHLFCCCSFADSHSPPFRCCSRRRLRVVSFSTQSNLPPVCTLSWLSSNHTLLILNEIAPCYEVPLQSRQSCHGEYST